MPRRRVAIAATLGERLAELRGKAGVTQAQLAARMGTSRATVIRIEGEDRPVSDDDLRDYLRALGRLPTGAEQEGAVFAYLRYGVRSEGAAVAAIVARLRAELDAVAREYGSSPAVAAPEPRAPGRLPFNPDVNGIRPNEGHAEPEKRSQPAARPKRRAR